MTIIEGLERCGADPDKILRLLRRELSCGGWRDSGQIKLQGNHLRDLPPILHAIL